MSIKGQIHTAPAEPGADADAAMDAPSDQAWRWHVPTEEHQRKSTPAKTDLALKGDCANCFALCCVAPALTVSPEFAIDKEAGHACPHLLKDFRCDIHERLSEQGFVGCTLYDCFGAGQKVSQVTFGGKDWRRDPDTARHMFAVFGVMRDLHELLWYLANAVELEPARTLRGELDAAFEEISELTYRSPDALAALDVAARRRTVGALLLRVGELVQAKVLATLLTDPAGPHSDQALMHETGLTRETLKPVLTRLAGLGWIAEQPAGQYRLTERGMARDGSTAQAGSTQAG
jgi:hypothetical protein